MNPSDTLDHALIADVERLKAEVANTQDLYREVCALMFFRYGTPPTANRLYQLVRRGSMSAPATALKAFWAHLREKSRVRIDHPDLPEALKDSAAQLLLAMWRQAQAQAQQQFDAQTLEATTRVAQMQAKCAEEIEQARADADASVADAARSQAAERHRADVLAATLAQAEHTLARNERDAAERLATLQSALAEEKTLHQHTRDTLDAVRQELAQALARTEHLHAQTASQLDAIRQTAQAAEQRHLALERRTLLDLDQERTRNSRLAKLLEQAQLQSTHWMSAQEQTAQRHQEELAQARSRAGELDKSLLAARAADYQQRSRIVELERQLLELRDAARVALRPRSEAGKLARRRQPAAAEEATDVGRPVPGKPREKP